MNVLIIGSGGREHALAWKIKQSPKLGELYIAPGNPGTLQLGTNVELNSESEILEFCRKYLIDLVVIGPEQPLVNGLSDYLRANGINVFGPSKAAARIEGDKTFSKNLMKKYDISTAQFKSFNSDQFQEAAEYLKNIEFPIVLKASGLAAGKGVLICSDYEDALEGLKNLMQDKVFGSAGDHVVIEEFMYGQEASVFAITDGTDYVLLPPAQDHKRIYDGDKGKNTGGMGAYAPAPIITAELLGEIEDKIIKPTIAAMKSEGIPYSGCLYCGLMLTDEGPKVVEFNCRFGDPETQAVLPLVDGDFLALLHTSAIGEIDKNAVSWTNKTAVCVVAASAGYPDAYTKGFEISGINEAENKGAIVFHAGTKNDNNKLVTSGGRVLGVTALVDGNDLKACKQKTYDALSNIRFEGIYYRTDIADKGINYKE